MNRNSIIFFQENAFEIVVCQNDDHFVQGEMSLNHIYAAANVTVDKNAFPNIYVLYAWNDARIMQIAPNEIYFSK